jgi:Fe-S-cluster-containing dehydrogenase component
MSIDRRAFLGVAGLSALALAGRSSLGALGKDQPAASSSSVRWAMAIDVRKCLQDEGCTECTAACHKVHNVPSLESPAHKINWIWKESYEHVFPAMAGPYTEDALKGKKLPVLCNHCERPSCVRVCPTRATWKREDGIVMMDWHRCVGCRYCIAACPYGSRSFNWVEPRPAVAELDPGFPARTKGVVEKCTFCEERLAVGQPPACVEACKQKALVFGNITDPASELRDLLRTRNAIRRKPELGTQPEIYYIL